MQPKTEKLTLKVLTGDKRALERIAAADGEPVAVIVRRFIREGVQRYGLAADTSTPTTPSRSAAQP